MNSKNGGRTMWKEQHAGKQGLTSPKQGGYLILSYLDRKQSRELEHVNYQYLYYY